MALPRSPGLDSLAAAPRDCSLGAHAVVEKAPSTRFVPLAATERHAINGRRHAMSFGRRAVSGRSGLPAHPVTQRRRRILDDRRLVLSPRKPSASGGEANSSTISPPADNKQTSIPRLRSSPDATSRRASSRRAAVRERGRCERATHARVAGPAGYRPAVSRVLGSWSRARPPVLEQYGARDQGEGVEAEPAGVRAQVFEAREDEDAARAVARVQRFGGDRAVL